jgi:zinc protease
LSQAVLNLPANAIQLENGLTVVHQYIPATPVVVADVWIKAGAIAEPREWNGIAHFLEHMVFKGTKKLPPGAFDRAIESKGGVTNAATSHDYTHYFITTAATYLEDTLPVLAELLLNAEIPEDEFERERDVVLEEIRSCQDNPDFLGFQALTESVYQYHPYGRSILGTEADLMQRSPEQIRSFHRSHYRPENMTVAIVGGVKVEEAVEVVKRSFQPPTRNGKCPQVVAEAEPPIAEIRRQQISLPRIEQARLLMAWMGPGVERLRDAYGLDLLSVLLAEGRSSRLVRSLREEDKLVHSIGSSFSLQRDSSLFTVSAILEPENLERVEAIICDRIAQLQAIPISDAELNRCKRVLCNDYAFSTEAPNQLAGLYGYYHTIANLEVAVTYPDRIASFQAAELQRLAQQYLSPNYYAVTVLKPC